MEHYQIYKKIDGKWKRAGYTRKDGDYLNENDAEIRVRQLCAVGTKLHACPLKRKLGESYEDCPSKCLKVVKKILKK